MGQSVGTGPTTWLAKKLCQTGQAPKSVVLITPFTSAVSVASESAATVTYISHAVSEETLDIFDNRYHIQRVTCPVQIIAGTRDQVTPHSQAEYLTEIAPNSLPMISLQGSGHNDVWSRDYFASTMNGIRTAVKL